MNEKDVSQQSTELTEKCGVCGKDITEHDYIVNWTSCNECWDKEYEKYLAEKAAEKNEP